MPFTVETHLQFDPVQSENKLKMCEHDLFAKYKYKYKYESMKIDWIHKIWISNLFFFFSLSH